MGNRGRVGEDYELRIQNAEFLTIALSSLGLGHTVSRDPFNKTRNILNRGFKYPLHSLRAVQRNMRDNENVVPF